MDVLGSIASIKPQRVCGIVQAPWIRRQEQEEEFEREREKEIRVSFDSKMVRAPCCEKMGLKKGPWTQEEDEILTSFIQKHGHGNWRALPKQAGLLRCGKSCRLRWMNYLRPDIKRGNFTREEEEAIINLHELLGNRWSAIAARLPGRTDNEIKNVWHTHLKKRLTLKQNSHESKKKAKIASKPVVEHQRFNSEFMVATSEQSFSGFSSEAESSILSGENCISVSVKEESFSSEELQQIDECFWSETLSINNCNSQMDFNASEAPFVDTNGEFFGPFSSSSSEDDMDFWLRVFLEAGEIKDLPQI